MLLDHWPLVGLSLRAPDLELRWPTDEELAALADVAAEGVHDPSFMPFGFPWTDTTAANRARSVILHYWRRAGLWKPEDWQFNFVVFRGGQPVGIQTLAAENFAITKEVHTGSWLGMRFHGQGIGTQMRAAVLEFAFTTLGADTACSGRVRGQSRVAGRVTETGIPRGRPQAACGAGQAAHRTPVTHRPPGLERPFRGTRQRV